MRLAIGVLLLLNLTLALWQLFFDRAEDGATGDAQPDIGELRLLSERDPALQVFEKPAILSDKAPPKAMSEPQFAAPVELEGPARPDGVQNQHSESPLTFALSDRQAIEPDKESDLVEGQAASARIPAGVEETRLPAVQVGGAQPIPSDVDDDATVGNEVEGTQQPPANIDTRQQPTPPAPTGFDIQAQAASHCWQLPAVDTRDLAEEIAKGLPARAELLGIAEVQESRISSYYVLVPAAANRSEANHTLELLRDKGVADTWLFTSGPLKYAISLGLFNREQNASSHAASIRKLGVDAQIHPREQAVQRFAMQVSVPADMPRQRLERLLPGELIAIECEQIASPQAQP